MAVHLGPFEIQERFAFGGMGEVWRGLHLEQNVPVAIKVITGPNALMPSYQEEFRREVQAVARLNHPNVVQVFDYGSLPEQVSVLQGLLPGSPYLVMEYASRGSLSSQMDPVNWRDLKNILMSVLGGLSHAHSRGLIHRDIKPGNVLLGSLHETPPRIILTDFGVAHVVDSNTRSDAMDLTSRSTEEASGTPRYMAPEQFMGKWRDYGPWTDLYAVGIMAYQLASGSLPFRGATFMMLAMAHINNEMPPLEPRIKVPDGFDKWIRRMTMKKPSERFQSAADAAWALTQLNDSHLIFEELSNIVGTWDGGDAEEEYDSTDVLPTRIDFAPPEALRIFTMSRTAQQQKRYEDAPALPLTWQEAEPPQQTLSLVGAGLGLFGLRSIPVVDRDELRQRLWDDFKSVYQEGKPKAIVLQGLAGAGKTRLCEWLGQFAEEIGAASVMHATHSEMPGTMHGIGGMLTRHFRAAGLSAEDMSERVAAALRDLNAEDEYEVRALTEIMRTHMVDTAQSSKFVRFTSADQRYVVVRRELLRASKRRPIVVVIDDAHFGWDSIEFVASVLTATDATPPVLFVLAVQDEGLKRDEERSALEHLLALPNARRVVVPPLSNDHIDELAHLHLGLPRELATEISARAAGSPLFAVQLVEDWVKRGILVVDGASFVLKRGETANFPLDLAAIWASRIDYLIGQFGRRPVSDGRITMTTAANGVRTTLEIAAALGQDVQLRELEAACAKAGTSVPDGLIDELARLRLATQAQGSQGFSFINAQLRDVLVQSARDADRWSAHNTLCAQVLTSLYDDDQPGLALRVGRHFLEAGQFLLAVTCLEAAYQRAHGAPEQRDTAEIVDLLELTYQAMKLKESDVRWAEIWVRRGVPLIYSEDAVLFQQGVELLERAENVARGAKSKSTLASILRARAWAFIYTAELERALTALEESDALVPNDANALAASHRIRGQILLHQAKPEAAEAQFHKVLELAPDSIQSIWAKQQLGDCAVRTGRLDAAQDHYNAALEAAREVGVVLAEAQVYECEGSLAMRFGDFATAEKKFRDALRIRELMSGRSTLQSRSSEFVARALLAQHRFAEADQLLTELQARPNASSRALFVHPHDALLACAAANNDWDQWDALVDPACRFGAVLPDFAHVATLTLALGLARAAGEQDRADALWRVMEATFPTSQLDATSEVIDTPILSSDDTESPVDRLMDAVAVLEEDDLREDSEPDVFEPRRIVNVQDALAAIQDSSADFEPYEDNYYEDSDAGDDDLDDASDAQGKGGDDEGDSGDDGDASQDEEHEDELFGNILETPNEIDDDLDELDALEVPSATRMRPLKPQSEE